MKTFIATIILACTVGLHDIYASPSRAEVSSQQWQGVKVDTILGNAKYPDTPGAHDGFPFILYNVGTGRFITQGGDWAMEGRLFYSDFGRTMYLCSNGRINSGITEKNISNTKNSFCTRPPEPFGKTWADNNYEQINLTTLMDGDSKKYNQTWTFERVSGETSDTCTYYMYQTYGTSKKYYLGAVWGECHNSHIGKGDGQLIFMDDDRSCWTTAPVKGVTTRYHLENGDDIELQKLYQWRLISIDEFLHVLNSETAGLNPSVSALIPDRDFTRNDIDFFSEDGWLTSLAHDYTYESGTKRYPFTWGNYKMDGNVKENKQRSLGVINEPWDSPVRLKAIFDADISQARGKKDAKYGFMEFEGAGSIYTNFQVTKPGWYEITTIALCQSDVNDAYMFARVINDADVSIEESEFPLPAVNTPDYGSIEIERIPYGTYTKGDYESCLTVGKELLINGDSYKRRIWVLVTDDDFNNGRKTIRIGVHKNGAVKSQNTSGAYYDTDWVCVDDFHALYMGLAPAFFYEDMETLDYLDDVNHPDLYLQNEYPKNTPNSNYSGSASLERKFTEGAWNTFSFPLPMSGEQVRYAFGEDAQLLALDGIGTISRSENIIDFKTVDLITSGIVIEPGRLYLLKPTKKPVYGETPRGDKAYYYDLGRMFFSVKDEDENYRYPIINLDVIYNSKNALSWLGKNDGAEHTSYVQTTSYNTFRVDRNGYVLPRINTTEHTYAPKGSYIMSGGKMIEISRDTPIKGFRGCITLSHSIFEDASLSQTLFSINGVLEMATATSEIYSSYKKRLNSEVYDITGRKHNSAIKLPRGIYVTAGKTIIIK